MSYSQVITTSFMITASLFLLILIGIYARTKSIEIRCRGKIFYKLERVNYAGSKLIKNIPKFLKLNKVFIFNRKRTDEIF